MQSTTNEQFINSKPLPMVVGDCRTKSNRTSNGHGHKGEANPLVMKKEQRWP